MSKRETKKNNFLKCEFSHAKCSRRILRVKKNKNSKIVDIVFARIGVELVSKLVVHRNIFKLNRWRKKEENDQSHHWYLLIAFSCVIQIQTLEYENEPSPEVFQEVTICSCDEVIVRITDDVPSLN